MAIARGAGTEIIRSAHFEGVNSTDQTLIKGVQHHIYTVLSIICHCENVETTGHRIQCYIQGYDSKGGTTAQSVYVFKEPISADNDTFVWNDKFSFNGYEPTDFAGPMDDATKQDAIADQGSSVSQSLIIFSGHASDLYDIHITFIDQNNA